MKLWNFVLTNFVNYDSEDSLAFRFRKKRSERIMSLIDIYWSKNGSVSIIDIGGSQVYWKIISKEFLRDRKVHITVLNLPSEVPLPDGDEIFSFVTGDGCDLSRYHDKEFDIAHSNSVIEHVGEKDRVKSFISESRRVGKTCYLQTPNFWFPVEVHFLVPFFHWTPLSFRARMLTLFDLGQFKKVTPLDTALEIVENIRLLTACQLRRLFPDGRIFREKFLFFTKSFIVIDRLQE